LRRTLAISIRSVHSDETVDRGISLRHAYEPTLMAEAATPEIEHAYLRAGLVIADKYRLVEAKGQGAMGAVWGAEHITLGNRVAIKFLHRSVAASAEARSRFDTEAKVAARLGEASRHITRVMDHGVTSEGTPFLVMELLHGEGLEVLLKRERRLPIAIVAKITSQLCKALNVAHQAGVVHRDLKPANVFLTHSADDGDLCVKLLDFGVAKAGIESDEEQSTRSGALVGTPNYMSPEQITGDREVDSRSDLWAVSAIVYRMAVGRAPFGSGALNELAMRITSSEAPTPTTLAPDLPPEFDEWVVKGFAKSPEGRYQTAKDLADTLAVVAGCSSAGGHLTGTFPAIAPEYIGLQIGDSVGGVQVSEWGRRSAVASVAMPQPKRSRKVPFVALALVACAAIAFFVVRGRGTGRSSAAAPTPTTAPAPTTPPTASASTTASASATASVGEPAASDTATAPSTAPSATAAPTAIPTYHGPIGAPTTTTTTAKAPASAAAEPPPPAATVDPKQKGGDLWKKTDEM
jgi:serine/threonine-protein kinase